MKRRALLAAIGTATVAGCIGSADEDSDGGKTDQDGSSSTGPSDGEPEAHPDEPEILEGVDYELEFGEWFEGDRHGIRIDGIEATTTFTKTTGERAEKEMPDGKQLVFVDLTAKRLSPDAYGAPSPSNFATVYDRTIYEPVESLEVESCWYECHDSTDIDWIEKADEKPRLAILRDLEHGETREFWYAAVLDATVSRDEIIPVYDSGSWVAWTA